MLAHPGCCRQTQKQGCAEAIHTPTDQDVAPEVFPLIEEGDGQQSVELEGLHQQPAETRHDAIMEENHHCFAAHLEDNGDAPGSI